jgi:low affinity Fe/Cu permease
VRFSSRPNFEPSCDPPPEPHDCPTQEDQDPRSSAGLLEPACLGARFSCSMVSYIRNLLTKMGVLTARPGVFFVIAVYALLWVLLSPDTFEWHAAATLATWMMTVFIQRAAHRDTQAIHAKLDHLLEKLEPADGSLAGLDRMQPEDIEKFRRTHSPV